MMLMMDIFLSPSALGHMHTHTLLTECHHSLRLHGCTC